MNNADGNFQPGTYRWLEDGKWKTYEIWETARHSPSDREMMVCRSHLGGGLRLLEAPEFFQLIEQGKLRYL